MVRNSHLMKRIENHNSRQITYSKRRESILRQAAELSTYCETEVGLLMFSPAGRLTTYATKGRIEDMFLRYIEESHDDLRGPIENEEYLCQSLKHLKYEAEILEKLDSLEALEKKLHNLNRQKYEAQEKLRSYNPNVSKILTIEDAQYHHQFIINAIRRIEKLKNAKKFENGASPSNLKEAGMPAIEVILLSDSESTADESANSKRKRNEPEGDEKKEAGSSSTPHEKEEVGSSSTPHLTISFLKNQTGWNL